jgi:N-glycosylase/DNA lyase
MIITREDRREVKKVLKKLGRRKTKESIFYDLCFCLCAPQCKFENNIEVIKELKSFELYKRKDIRSGTDGVLYIPKLRSILRPVRFYNNKAKYIIEAKINFKEILKNIKPVSKDDCGYAQREWLVKNVKGMGMKAASHFLRNQGYDALAIIDTHIIKFLAKEHLDYPHFITKRWNDSEADHLILFKKLAVSNGGYKELEMLFQESAGSMDLTTAELDAIIWKQRSGTDWKEFIH